MIFSNRQINLLFLFGLIAISVLVSILIASAFASSKGNDDKKSDVEHVPPQEEPPITKYPDFEGKQEIDSKYAYDFVTCPNSIYIYPEGTDCFSNEEDDDADNHDNDSDDATEEEEEAMKEDAD